MTSFREGKFLEYRDQDQQGLTLKLAEEDVYDE